MGEAFRAAVGPQCEFMRLILLTGLLVATFVFGFLFAHEPFRQVVIEKTVRTFFSDEESPRAKPAAREQSARNQPTRERSERTERSGRSEPPPADELTEKDRRSLDDLFEDKLDQ